jgi:hypothetical protein
MVSGGKLISRPRRIAGRLLGVAVEGEGLFDEGVEIATRQRDWVCLLMTQGGHQRPLLDAVATPHAAIGRK